MSGRGRGFRRGGRGGFRRTVRDRNFSNQEGGGNFGRMRRRTQQEARSSLGRFSQAMARRTGRPAQRPSGSDVNQSANLGRFRRNDNNGGFSNRGRRGGFGGRGGQRGGRGRGGRGNQRGNQRGGRGGRRGGRVSEQSLDKELDAYMNKSDKHASAQLDAELEEYQAQTK